MTRQDNDIRERLKAEADELLFADLHFDADMKEKVRRLAAAEQEQPAAESLRRTPGRAGWLAGIGAAAACLGLLWIAGPLMDRPAEPLPPGEPPNHTLAGPNGTLADPNGTPAGPNGTFAGPNGTPPGPSGTFAGPDGTPAGPNGTFAGPDDGAGSPPAPYAEGPRVLAGYEEASSAFGDGLLVPAYLPDGFAIREINVTGPDNGGATSAAFSFVNGERSFGIFAQKEQTIEPPHDSEAVDVNGSVGHLIAGTSIQGSSEEMPNVELHWEASGIHYMISGLLTGEEALAVARSMKAPESR